MGEHEVKRIEAPLLAKTVNALRAGMRVAISGTLLTARDAAHKRLVETVERGETLPVDLKRQVLYYTGPSPAPLGLVIGSAGPTTSGRMDPFTPKLLALGVRGMIGKGQRSPEVVEAIKNYRAVYFVAIGGAGALLSQHIVASQVLAYPELGPEAIRRLEVEDFPAIVVIDCRGGNLYERGLQEWKGRASAPGPG